MYPAYTFESALEVYAIRFFVMLEDGYKAMYGNYRMQATIALLPYTESEARKEFLDILRSATEGDDATMEPVDNVSGIDQLKKILGGN